MNISNIFAKGGPVVWILFTYSVIALAIAFERYLHFIRMRRLSSQFIF